MTAAPSTYDPSLNRYPAWRYHKDHDAKLVKNPDEDAALGQGWVNSPAFVESGVPVAATPNGPAAVAPVATVSFPAWRYHASVPDGRLVKTPEDLAALGAGWVDSPAKIGAAVVDAAPAAEPTQATQVTEIAPPPPPAPPAPPAEKSDADLEEEARATQFGLPVEEIAVIVSGVTDADLLQRIRARETTNPKHEGGRKGVLEAIDKRVKALGHDSPPPQE